MNDDQKYALIAVSWNRMTGVLEISANAWLLATLGGVFFLLLIIRWLSGGFSFTNFEIDQAEIGVGQNKFRFKPNITDRQVAYAIWVELSTRKIGLPIDLDHDVVAEIYDSWYNFFSVTRELIKSVPVNQVKRASTQAIIKLSIEVLNEGLRPHLTRWQARFRSWYNRELKRYEGDSGIAVLDPQQIQATFPQYQELKQDLERVNDALIRYRKKMRELVLSD